MSVGKVTLKSFYKVVSFALVAVMFVCLLPSVTFAEDHAAAKGQIVGGGDFSYYDKDGKPQNALNNDTWVQVSKTIKDAKDLPQLNENEFEIALEVRTKLELGKITITPPDVAVTLVIDNSKSTAGGDGKTDRLTAAKTAAKKFVDEFSKEANGGGRYISVVAFDRTARTLLSWTNVGDTGNPANYNNAIAAIDTLKSESTVAAANLEAGLQLAGNLQNSANLPKSSITDRYIILLSDGHPTCYMSDYTVQYTSWPNTSRQIVLSPDRTGADRVPKNPKTPHPNGGRWNLPEDWFTTTDTTNVKIPQEKAASVAAKIRNGNGGVNKSTLYAIVFGAEAQMTWIKEHIASQDCAFKADDANAFNQLNKAFGTISEEINRFADAYILTDPMGKYIVWDTGNDLQAGQSFKDNTFTWDLKDAGVKPSPDGKWHIYKRTYKVKLDVAAAAHNDAPGAFDDKVGISSGDATLKYRYVEKTGDNAYTVSGPERIADFKTPTVFGYRTDLQFTKVHNNSDGNEEVVTGAAFTLYKRDGDHWLKFGEEVHDVNGTRKGEFEFNKLSTGNYRLTESVIPAGYKAAPWYFYFNVSYGTVVKVAGKPTFQGPSGNYSIENERKQAGVEVTKTKLDVDFAPNGGRAAYALTIKNTTASALKMITLTDTFNKVDTLDKVDTFGEAGTFGKAVSAYRDLQISSSALGVPWEKITELSKEKGVQCVVKEDNTGYTIEIEFPANKPLEQNEAIDIKYEVDFPPPGAKDILWRNTAEVIANTSDGRQVDDVAYVDVTQRRKHETPVTPAAIFLTKRSNTTTVPANEATYTLVVKNTGGRVLTNIAIEDYFPGRSAFAPAYGYKFSDSGAKATVNERGNGFAIDFGAEKLEPGKEIEFTYKVVFPANRTRAKVDWNNIARVAATPEGGGARVIYSDNATVSQQADGGNTGNTINGGGGGGNGGGKGIDAGKGDGEKGTVTGGGGDEGSGNGAITSPSGKAPVAPPRPTSPDNSLIPGPNGTYIEIGEDGVRIGEWYWDDLTAQWIFSEYMPRGVLPQTGATLPAGADAHARGAAHIILPAVRKEAEDNANNDGAVV